MKRPLRFASCLFAAVGAVALLRADVTLAPLFGDGAVLQRDAPVPVWGRAAPGEKLTVRFAGQTREATAGPDGRWLAMLEPLAATVAGSDLVVTGKTTVTLRDVVVGEVWLGAGDTAFLPARPGAAPRAETPPAVRHLRVAAGAAATPAEHAETGGWRSAPAADDFEAAARAFGRDLHATLGVPVGLVLVAAADAPLAAWLSPAALAAEPARTAAPDDAVYFNGGINPLLPGVVRGVLWLHGTQDAARFGALIRAWRAHLGQGDVPFLWAQPAARKTADDADGLALATVREALARALALPATAQATAIDLGRDPGAAREIGRRLALLAKHRVYGDTGDVSGPVFESVRREGAALRVLFAHAAGGLIARDKPVQALQLAGEDRVFYPAAGRIERDTLVVTSPAVKAPVAVRYAWSSAPEANLYNGAGLPAPPFRSDTW